MRSFGVVFVLYHPSDEFITNLIRARAACPTVIAVDNSPAADSKLHRMLHDSGLAVIFNRNEGGLAGAYNRGAKHLIAQGSEVLFFLDQDSQIETSFFSRMMQAAENLGTDTFLMGPKIYEVRLKRCMPVIKPDSYLPKTKRIDEVSEGLFPALCVISSGSAVSAAAYSKLGEFREDYFIEYLDVEYCLRAKANGIPVYMNAGVTLRQQNGDIQRRGKQYTTNHAASRRYYISRNSVHCLRSYRKYSGIHWFSELMLLQQAWSVLRMDSRKVQKLFAMLCGYVDGVTGKLGRFENRHPRIASFCAETTRARRVSTANSSTIVAGSER